MRQLERTTKNKKTKYNLYICPLSQRKTETMDFLGLIFECIFFGLGLFLYLYSKGKVKITTHGSDAKAEAFRQKNSRWLRILSLLLMAVMSFEIVLHLRDLILG
jgi:hypothetical protein